MGSNDTGSKRTLPSAAKPAERLAPPTADVEPLADEAPKRKQLRPNLPPKEPRFEGERTLTDSDDTTADGLSSEEHAAMAEEEDELGDATGEHDYPIPPGWDFDDLNNQEFWTKIFALEDAALEGLPQFKKALRAEGFLSEGHFSWVKERFMERHGGDTNFPESMMLARQAKNHAAVQQAVGAELLEPIGDVTLGTYATIRVKREVLPRQDAGAFARLLAEYQLSEKKWALVDEAWKARLNDPANVAAADTVGKEYRRHFNSAARRFAPGVKLSDEP